ncbi:hypothetical protein CC79DRAFT_817159 [Sarocladium strictum]
MSFWTGVLYVLYVPWACREKAGGAAASTYASRGLPHQPAATAGEPFQHVECGVQRSIGTLWFVRGSRSWSCAVLHCSPRMQRQGSSIARRRNGKAIHQLLFKDS